MPKGMKGFQKGALNPSATVEGKARIKRWASQRGPLSAQTRKKLSASLRKTLSKPEMREKWAMAQEGSTKSVETRKKISIGQRKGRAKKMSSCLKYADSAFSKYIRLKYADENGEAICITCDSRHSILEMDCGHYVSRQHKSLRWDERNAHPQCKWCNRFNEGRKDVYALKLIQKYGPLILEELQAEKRMIEHISKERLLDIAREYKAKAKELAEERWGLANGGYHAFIDKTLPVGDVAVEPDGIEEIAGVLDGLKAS